MLNLSLEQCHSTMLTNINEKGDKRCSPILPYPKEMILPHQTPLEHKIPATFRFKTNYKEKLDSVNCHAIYSQYNTLALNEAIESGQVIKPRFMVAPMKANIQFFKKDSTIMFSMSNQEFDNIQSQAAKLPSYFNWMDNEKILRPFNQGLCGSCWAVSSATCLSDVFAVSKKVDSNPNLSPTYLLSCLPQAQCNGGDPSMAVSDMSSHGISSADCLDYSWCTDSGCSGDPLKHFDAHNINQYIPPCHCSSKSKTGSGQKYFADQAMAICIPPVLTDFDSTEMVEIKYFLQSLYGNVSNTGVDLSTKTYLQTQALIKNHIYNYGPVLGGFHVFKNFFKGDYRETNDIYVENVSYSGVQGLDYSDLERDWVGSHAVVIVGWGKDTVHGESVDYWLVRNSWGEAWGIHGIFKMAMYGNDPNKKYQNRISQFEYPAIVNTDQGIGITGGIILMKAGNITPLDDSLLGHQNNPHPPTPAPNPPNSQSGSPQNQSGSPQNQSGSPQNQSGSPQNQSGSPEVQQSPEQEHHANPNSSGYTFLSFLIFFAFLISLYFIFRQNQDIWLILIEALAALIITCVFLSLVQTSSNK